MFILITVTEYEIYGYVRQNIKYWINMRLKLNLHIIKYGASLITE